MPNITRMLTGTTVAALSILLNRIGPDNRAWLARQVVRNRHSNRTKSLVEFSELVALAHANAQYDIAINGEKWLLERIAAFFSEDDHRCRRQSRRVVHNGVSNQPWSHGPRF